MNFKTEKYTIWAISGYKLIINTIRIIFGLLIFAFGCDSRRVLELLTSHEIAEDSSSFTSHFLINHINPASVIPTCSLALALVIISLLEIVFLVAIFRRKYYGAVGFFIVSLLWIPLEMFFISKFLLVSRLISLLINLVIILFFLKIILSHDKYFKR